MDTTLNKRRFFVFYLLGLVVFALLAAMAGKYFQTGQAFTPTTLLMAGTIFLLSAGIGLLTIVMVEKAKKLPHQKLAKRIIPLLLVFYMAAYLIANMAIALTTFLWFLHIGRNLNEFWGHLFKYEISFGNSQLFIWLMFFTIVLFYVLWMKSLKKEQQMREEKLKFQYNNLKAQINPHFLFNSMNTLSELVYQDAQQADKYIKMLSGIYRYVLENEHTDLIGLHKELEFVKQYFSLQAERDSEKIFLSIEIDQPEDYGIVPVSLQLLIENAFKHNSCSKTNPLSIKIEIENDYIVVSNKIKRKTILEESMQIGLRNLKERIDMTMDKSITWYENDGYFIVKLPLIKDK